MHPADQFEAFAALVAEGRPIEDIAADFSVTPLVVQRRLETGERLAAPDGGLSGRCREPDQLMALHHRMTTPRRKPRSTMRLLAALTVRERCANA